MVLVTSEFTPNYDMPCPTPDDSMADVGTFLNDSLNKLEAAANPTQIIGTPGALPTTGSYKVGDRIYLASDQSSYILFDNSSTWGLIWRPIQAAISPWTTVPDTAFYAGALCQQHPTNPWQYALDNKGNCHWRGALRLKTGNTFPNNDPRADFANLPAGLRKKAYGNYLLCLDPATPESDVGLNGFKAAAWQHTENGGHYITYYNAASAQDVWFTSVWYEASEMYFVSP